MCFQIPKQIKSINQAGAVVEGNLHIKLGAIKAAPGDYLLCYGNMAVEKVTKEKAEDFRRMLVHK